MKVVLFHRKEGFYPIELLSELGCGKSYAEQIQDNAKINKGTVKVTCPKTNEVLWKDKEAGK